MDMETRGIRITERFKWRRASNQLKRHYLCNHIEKTTGERVDPSDSYIVFAVDYIDAAYSLNITYRDRKPYEIFERLQEEDLR